MNFAIFNPKDTEDILAFMVEHSGQHFQLVESGTGDYAIAFSLNPFTQQEAQHQYELGIQEMFDDAN